MRSPKNLLTLILIVVVSTISFSQQNVGIGTATPNSNAMLDISSTNKGVLIPRVALTGTNSASPLGGFVAGMMVYNTATAGVAPNNVTPGFYFCNGSKWEKAEGGWSLSGNAGTSPTSNFIGTTDNQDLVFKRNNAKAGLINNASFNTSFGVETLNSLSSGISNTAFGHRALFTNTTGASNTAIGYKSLNSNIDASNLIAIGDSALYTNGVGANIAFDEGQANTAVGSKAFKLNTKGKFGTAIGHKALMKNTTGFFNTAVGHEALVENTTGSANAAFGQGTLNKTTAGANSAFGVQSLSSLTTGSTNTAIGWRSGLLNQTGVRNIFIGPEAGYNELGSNKLYIENTNADSTNALIFGNFATDNLKLNAYTQVHKSTDGTPLLHAKNTNSIASIFDYAAIKGENNVSDWYGVGVEGVGGWTGTRGIANGTGGGEYRGVYGESTGASFGTNRGVFGFAANSSVHNFGVWGESPIGPNNYAGYFNGVVAIGDGTPKKATGYLLSVNGKIAAEEVLVDLDGDWPDYVFKQDYDLKSLEEVKAFIEINGHLPNVPSAQEVEDNGILLGDMNKVLMEKIEELTLYILQQEEEIKNEKLLYDKLRGQMKSLEERLEKLEK